MNHEVRPGENLSHDVLGNQISGQVLGEQGSLKKVLKINPNLIFPDQEIILGVPDRKK